MTVVIITSRKKGIQKGMKRKIRKEGKGDRNEESRKRRKTLYYIIKLVNSKSKNEIKMKNDSN